MRFGAVSYVVSGRPDEKDFVIHGEHLPKQTEPEKRSHRSIELENGNIAVYRIIHPSAREYLMRAVKTWRGVETHINKQMEESIEKIKGRKT